MPNHITNRLTIVGTDDQVTAVLDFIKGKNEDGEDVLMDFNKIIPMPESLDILSSSEGSDGMKYLLGMSGNSLERKAYQGTSHYKKMAEMESENPDRFEKCMEIGRQYLHNIASYGHPNWYDWRLANWETKWNAYETQMTAPNVIEFQTAWSGVTQLMSILASKFTEVEFEYLYADENIGYNIGDYRLHGDEVEDFTPTEDTAAAWEIVFELGVADRDEFVQEPDGSWKWKCDEDE